MATIWSMNEKRNFEVSQLLIWPFIQIPVALSGINHWFITLLPRQKFNERCLFEALLVRLLYENKTKFAMGKINTHGVVYFKAL